MTDISRVDVEIIDPNDLPDDLEDGFDPCEEGENLDELVGVFAFGTTTRHVMATWLPAAFRKWGVKYRLVAGWETRGRPLSAGSFDPNALLTHHTGSTSSATNPRPSLKTLIEGRTGLKGPLCQIATDYNGVTDIVAAGRANHAGSARAAMGNLAGDGNAMYLGNEVQTNGTQRMPDVQYQAIVLVSAAILDHFGYTNANKLGLHNTTSTSGKWDLGAGTGAIAPYSITKFRADVTARLKAGPPTTTPTGGFLMALTDKQQTDLYNRIMGGIPAGSAIGRKNPDGKPARLLDSADGDYLRRLILAGQVDEAALAAAVAAAIPAGSGMVTQETVEAALRSVLGSLDAGEQVTA